MIEMSLGQAAAATGGRLADGANPGRLITATVEFDSRRVRPGGLFVALPGERVDGHSFGADAVAAGAVAVLAGHRLGVPALVVDDPLAALGALAHEVLSQLPALTVIGVTGSAGKTTTKDLLVTVLSDLGPTVAPPGSFNTEIGHPYTVLRAEPSTRFLVLEYGARGVGHVAALSRIARPDIAVELGVGSAHLGEFGSVDAIARAKAELVESLAPGALALLNSDDRRVLAMAERTSAAVRTFGTGPDADVRAQAVEVDAAGRAGFTLVAGGRSAAVRLSLVGAHQVTNALAAAAVALAAGSPIDSLAAALSAAVPASRWRMEVTESEDGITVINDAYNANPESMAAAVSTLATIAAGRPGRSWAVLGGMAELGPATEAAHREVGAALLRAGIDRLVAVGDVARYITSGAPALRADTVAEGGAAAQLVRAQASVGDTVLVKASRVQGLESVAALLLAPDGAR